MNSFVITILVDVFVKLFEKLQAVQMDHQPTFVIFQLAFGSFQQYFSTLFLLLLISISPFTHCLYFHQTLFPFMTCIWDIAYSIYDIHHKVHHNTQFDLSVQLFNYHIRFVLWKNATCHDYFCDWIQWQLHSRGIEGWSVYDVNFSNGWNN